MSEQLPALTDRTKIIARIIVPALTTDGRASARRFPVVDLRAAYRTSSLRT